MKKFVFKVCGITALSIIGVMLVVFVAFLLFSPSTLAEFSDGVGDDKTACEYMYRQYKISGETTDLDKACVYALKSDDDALIVKYLGELTERSDFYTYCVSAVGTEYYDFICGKYVSRLFLSDAAKAAEKAETLTLSYTRGCALRSLAFSSVSAGDKKTAEYISEKLNDRLTAAENVEKQLIEEDLGLLTEFVG